MTADTKSAALAEKLDHHNRWRRGHEEYAMDDPTALGVTIDAAAALLRTQAASIAELEADLDDMTAERDDALQQPWPEWATKTLAVVREFSGYDGFDDADSGVDLPEETRECLAEVSAQAERYRAKVAELEAERVGLVAAERERCAALCSKAMPQPVANWSDAQIVEALRLVRDAILSTEAKP